MPSARPHRESLPANQLLEGDVIHRFGRDLRLETNPVSHPVFPGRVILAATVVEEDGNRGADVELNEELGEAVALVTALRTVLTRCLVCHEEYELLHDAARGQLHGILCEGCDAKASAGLPPRPDKRAIGSGGAR